MIPHPVTISGHWDSNVLNYNEPARWKMNSWHRRRAKTQAYLGGLGESTHPEHLLFAHTINEPPHDKTSIVAVRPAKTQTSLGIRPVWSESSLCAQWVAKDLSFLRADSEDLSDWADAQADLSHRWAHNHIVGFVMRRLKLWGTRGSFRQNAWYLAQLVACAFVSGMIINRLTLRMIFLCDGSIRFVEN